MGGAASPVVSTAFAPGRRRSAHGGFASTSIEAGKRRTVAYWAGDSAAVCRSVGWQPPDCRRLGESSVEWTAWWSAAVAI